MLLSIVYRRVHGAEIGPPPGHARPLDPAHAQRRAAAWLGDRAEHPAGVERRPAGEPGIALPRAPSSRTTGPDCRAVGRIREQSPGEVLRTDQGRPPAAGRGNPQLGTAVGRGRARARELTRAPLA